MVFLGYKMSVFYLAIHVPKSKVSCTRTASFKLFVIESTLKRLATAMEYIRRTLHLFQLLSAIAALIDVARLGKYCNI